MSGSFWSAEGVGVSVLCLCSCSFWPAEGVGVSVLPCSSVGVIDNKLVHNLNNCLVIFIISNCVVNDALPKFLGCHHGSTFSC